MQKLLWISKQNIRNVLYLPKNLLSWQNHLIAWQRFWQSYESYKRLANKEQLEGQYVIYPCLGDDTIETAIEPTYFYQDAWAFEKIVTQRPSQHIDVGSHHKFVALLSKVLPVTMVDIRPLSLPLESLQFKQGSILELPFADESVESLSSLCVVEHIGLGRYGDPLDPLGSEKAIAELCRVLAPGGRLYLSIPVGDRSIIAFNAGRIFSLDCLFELFKPLVVMDRSFIVGNSLQKDYQHSTGFGTTGLFELIKHQDV
jgi:SAM-dependent methyltransferase